MDTQVTRIPKLSRNGNFRSWAVLVEAVLTTSDDHDRFLSRRPAEGDANEQRLDRQARAKLIMCLGSDMLSLVEDANTTHDAFEALRADHLGNAVAVRSALLTEVTALRQSPKKTVKDYVAVGREYLLRLRDAGVEGPATLPIPCFKAGIDARLKNHVLPLLNQCQFDTDSEVLAQEFQRISVGMQGAGTVGQAHAADGNPGADRPGTSGERKKPWVERRTCFICGESGHIAKKCPKMGSAEGSSSKRSAPVVWFSQGNASSASRDDLLFDSGATHHIVSNDYALRDVGISSVSKIRLGGGEEHHVMGSGNLLIRSLDSGRLVVLTDVLYVPSLGYNLCSGAQLTAKGVTCVQTGPHLTLSKPSVDMVLHGDRVNNLYYLRCMMVPPAEGELHVSLATWHNRLGHPSIEPVKRMSKLGAVKGLGQIHNDKASSCEVCVAAKQQRVSHPRSDSRAARVCELIHTDLMCPKEEGVELASSSYVLTVMDDYSRYAEVVVIPSKSDASTTFRNIAARMEKQSGQLIQKIRFERGTEFYQLKEWMAENGIVPQPVPAYTPEANGRAERLNRTLIERVRALLIQYQLPATLWSYAMSVATYTRNRTLSVAMDVTPHELFYKIRPDVSCLRTFGCSAKVLIPAERRGKFEPVNEDGMFIGYAEFSKAWMVLVDTSTGLVIRESQNVVFDESQTCESLCDTLREYPDADVRPAAGSYTDLLITSCKPDADYVPQAEHVHEESDTTDTMSLLGGGDSQVVGAAEGVGQPEVSDEVQSQPRRSARTRNPPIRLHDAYAHLTSGTRLPPPTSIREAKERADWPLWQEAHNAELRSFCEKGVYDEVPISEVPEGRTLIPAKWVYDYKTDHQDRVIGHKVRCVAKGFRQTPGVDFGETYAPTMQDGTLRLLLQYAAEYKLAINQIDVKTAFLNGKLVEEVYIMPPPGLPLVGKAWKLNKSLYGLKQSALKWYEKWTSVVLSLGFKLSEADPCLFVGTMGEDNVRVGLYLDDALLFGSSSAVRKLVAANAKEFEIKDLGLSKPNDTFKFLGMELRRKVYPELGLFLSQQRYAEVVLEKFGMKDCKSVSSPMVPGVKLEHVGESLEEEKNEYAAIVGSLLYLAVKTRPDSAHAVGVLSRFMSCPRVAHLQAAKRVLRYIARDPGAGLWFRGHSINNFPRAPLSTKLYSDADFAADPIMRKSTSGILFIFNGAPIVWRSKLQSIVAQSTCEAEFVAAAGAIREGLWMQKLLASVTGKWRPIRMYCDNESALALLESAVPKVTGRTKHIDLQFWFVLDHIMKGDIVPQFVRTEEMLADGFTKPYSGNATEVNLKRIGMLPRFESD
jgi:hypothetical protein